MLLCGAFVVANVPLAKPFSPSFSFNARSFISAFFSSSLRSYFFRLSLPICRSLSFVSAGSFRFALLRLAMLPSPPSSFPEFSVVCCIARVFLPRAVLHHVPIHFRVREIRANRPTPYRHVPFGNRVRSFLVVSSKHCST